MIAFLSRYRNIFLTGLYCSLLLLTACTTTAISIEERTMARWDALLSGNLAGAYEFLSPGYRSSVSSAQYQKSLLLNRVEWSNVKYIKSECTETTCKVSILLGYTLRGGLPGVNSFEGSDTVKESWVLSGKNWYLVPDQ